MTYQLDSHINEIYLGGHYSKVWQNMLKVVQQNIDYPYSLLIYGQSGVGKTTIGKRFAQELNKNVVQVPSSHPIYPALYVKLTTLKSPAQLLSQILWVMGVTSVRGRPEVHALIRRLKLLLKEHQVKVIILDEMQNALPFAAGQKLLEISKTLTELLDDTNVPLILLGTPALTKLLEIDKRSQDFQLEEQIARRFRSPIKLPSFPSRAKAWIEAINFVTAKKGIAPLTAKDWQIISRLHIATDGRMALLQKLISLSKLSTELTSDTALNALKDAFNEGFMEKLNPFDLDHLSAKELKKITSI